METRRRRQYLSSLQDALNEGRLKKGDLVLLASVGAGFTVGTALLS
jgi:3-oxoacyl-[acyl-carrier-protein] synthase III